jgi:beta-xylosidase
MLESSASTYTNPVHPEYFADPYVWRCGSDYYAVGTGQAEAAGVPVTASAPSVFPLLHSRDLVRWRAAGQALVRPDPAVGNAFWAPEIAHCDGRWYLYYSAGHDETLHQLRVAVSEEPSGPYIDVAALTDTQQVPFAIDPHPFCDADGQWYLFHARDFLEPLDESGREARCGTALVVCRLHDMTTLAPEAHTVARARCDWQRYAANRRMYARTFDWHTLEGPYVVHHDGRYFCLYSGGCWQTRTYGVDYVVADTVLGAWSDAGVEAGPRVLRTVPGRVIGPGHCSVVTARDGATRYLAYHAWDADMTARRLCIDPLLFTRDGPRADGPSWTPRPAPHAHPSRAATG